MTWQRGIISSGRATFCLLIIGAALGVTGCETGTESEPERQTLGSIRVTTTTTGEDLDLSGYVVEVGSQRIPVDIDDVLVVSNVIVGSHPVELQDLADNCTVGDGIRRDVNVTENATTEVRFDIGCGALPPAEVDVTGVWSGTYATAADGGSLTYALSQNGDDVTAGITYDRNGDLFEYTGVGRVSGQTLVLFFYGYERQEYRDKVTATARVAGDEMTGEDEEQLDNWFASFVLSRQ